MDANEIEDGKAHDIVLDLTEGGVGSKVIIDGKPVERVKSIELHEIACGEATTITLVLVGQSVKVVGHARIRVKEHVSVGLIPPHPDRPEEGKRVIQETTCMGSDGGYREYEIVEGVD